MTNLNYEQAKRLIYVVYSIESGTGGHKQFDRAFDVSNYILKGIHKKSTKDYGFLHKNFSNSINLIKSAIANDKHSEQYYFTSALLNYILKSYIKNNSDINNSHNSHNSNNSNNSINLPNPK